LIDILCKSLCRWWNDIELWKVLKLLISILCLTGHQSQQAQDNLFSQELGSHQSEVFDPASNYLGPFIWIFMAFLCGRVLGIFSQISLSNFIYLFTLEIQLQYWVQSCLSRCINIDRRAVTKLWNRKLCIEHTFLYYCI
jgi:hypothetical protein